MALKYFFEYTDVENILHRCEIDDPDYTDIAIEVNGYVVLNSGNVDSPIECIRGTGLKVFLDASTDLTFSDLYSENDRNFKVTYIRNSVTEFVGFLNPEGLFEDYVQDRWLITLVCADGLSFLKNLSYVDNTTNERFTGKQSELEIVANCLKRTDLDLNINTSIGISYTGQTSDTNVLAETYLNAERFLKEDNQQTVMNCDEVLRSVLEKYNAIVIFRNGEWYILRPIELFNFTARTFYRYDSDGVALSPTTQETDFTTTLGSQIDGYYPHWANENQQKRIKNSIGAYRINYKYGQVTNVLDNPTLISSGGVLSGYTINEPTLIDFPPSEQGVYIKGSVSNVSVAISDSVVVSAQDTIEFEAIQKSGISTPFFLSNNDISYRVKVNDGATDYYLKGDGTWTTTITNLTIDVYFQIENRLIIQSDLIPVNGNLTVDIRDSRETGASDFVEVISLYIRPTTEDVTGVKGEIHTFQRIAAPSSKKLPNKTIYNGDTPSDLYIGTIYESDETTPTETWFRDGTAGADPILRIMGEDTMSMFQSPSIEFKGDIYGFIPYMSRILINNQDGIYIPIEYQYDISKNITSLKLRQIFGLLGSDIDYTYEFDYGNVVEPTIER